METLFATSTGKNNGFLFFCFFFIISIACSVVVCLFIYLVVSFYLRINLRFLLNPYFLMMLHFYDVLAQRINLAHHILLFA